MKRICIYLFYDCENIADAYIGYILKELKKVSDYLAVVCNGWHIADGIGYVEPYADKIFYRENKGLDAGAYKDVLCNFLKWDEVGKYDELMLVNDSFYGPLYPWEDTFRAMDGMDADFWGLTRAPAGLDAKGKPYATHVQSYFLVFRKEVLHSRQFRAFWEGMEYPKTGYECVCSFELGLNDYLVGHGFRGMALTDLYKLTYQEGEIPYFLYSLELIRDYKIPALKRKSLNFTFKSFGNAFRALEYIRAEGVYDVSLIEDHLSRISQTEKGRGGIINICQLEKFYKSHSNIWFYGAGTCGRNLALYFESRGWTFYGFLVTDTGDATAGCAAFDEADIGDEDGIIIAVGHREVFWEIFENVRKRCRKEQIFSPIYMV